MALGNNMKKTYNCKDSLKLQKYGSVSSTSDGKGSESSNEIIGGSRKDNSLASRIIEARMLSGTLFL